MRPRHWGVYTEQAVWERVVYRDGDAGAKASNPARLELVLGGPRVRQEGITM